MADNQADTESRSSTLSSSSEKQIAKQPATIERQVLNELTSEMLKSTADYIRAEVDMCTADYVTLEKMNRAVGERYKNFSDISTNITREMTSLNEIFCKFLQFKRVCQLSIATCKPSTEAQHY